MDKCRLTLRQIQALVAGRKVCVSYSALGEYGYVDRHEIELVLIEDEFYCKRCKQLIVKNGEAGFCNLCAQTDFGPYIDEAHGR